jgi:hypothetical protein
MGRYEGGGRARRRMWERDRARSGTEWKVRLRVKGTEGGGRSRRGMEKERERDVRHTFLTRVD